MSLLKNTKYAEDHNAQKGGKWQGRVRIYLQVVGRCDRMLEVGNTVYEKL